MSPSFVDELPAGPTEIPAGIFLGWPPAGTPTDRPCGCCCAWAMPIVATQLGRITPHQVALLYPEWLLYHLHVVLHQGGVVVS